jgi:hypothetical protein
MLGMATASFGSSAAPARGPLAVVHPGSWGQSMAASDCATQRYMNMLGDILNEECQSDDAYKYLMLPMPSRESKWRR